MKLWSVLGNSQRLDGGSMFGNCPRALWETWSPPDERHRISLACRALLIEEDSGRNVLCEAGIGAFFEPKLRDRFGVVESEHVLLASLAAVGKQPEDIDVIVLSHLHFDHAGGVLSAHKAGEALTLAFPNAAYVIGKDALTRAEKPHARDKASFIPELLPLLRATNRLHIVDGANCALLGNHYSFEYSDGHTPGLTLMRVEGHANGPVTFMGDLVPGTPWVHLPITMGYDRFPELLIEEKERILARIAAESGYAFFTHDPQTSHARIERDTKGKFVPIAAEARMEWS
jgi:glyoxylase-like metal-dependent hydrolase (beta-lactamase superfamily II)